MATKKAENVTSAELREEENEMMDVPFEVSEEEINEVQKEGNSEVSEPVSEENSEEMEEIDDASDNDDMSVDEAEEALLADDGVIEESEPKQKKKKERAPSKRERFNDARERERIAEQRRQERDRFSIAWKAMQQGMVRDHIFTGIVTGVDENEKYGKVMLAVSLEGQSASYRVKIVFEDIYRDGENAVKSTVEPITSAKDLMRRQKTMANKLIGAEIQFCIVNMLPPKDNTNLDDYMILGSRKKALQILEKQNYEAPNGVEPKIHEGSEVFGKVISVAYHSIQANIGGVDVSIPARFMTYRPMENMQLYYEPGQEIKVAVKSVKKNEAGETVIEVSGKLNELEAAKQKQATGAIRVGTTTWATITNYMRDKNRLICWLDSYEVPAGVNKLPAKAMYDEPKIGDQILVEIKGFGTHGMAVCAYIRKKQHR